MTRNDRVLLDLDERVELFFGSPDRISAMVVTVPAVRPRWISRAGDDQGELLPVAAYIEFDPGVLDDAWAVIRDDGRWEVRGGTFDGWPIDLRRLVDERRRLEVGETVRALADPVLRRLNGHD